MMFRGFYKNPSFCFGFISFVLLGTLFFGSSSLATVNQGGGVIIFNPFSGVAFEGESLYVNQQDGGRAIETPDLKIADSFVSGVATPNVVSPQTLGAILGGPNQDKNRKEVVEHIVQPGDTISSVAASFNISVNTLLWANDISKNATLKTGQALVILPADGVLHVAASGDTMDGIAKKYKAKSQDIIDFNGFSDLLIGDIVMVPGGVISPKAPISSIAIGSQKILPDSFFIPPLLTFKVTNGLHYYNAVDLSSPGGCGSPVYAAASGVVQRAVGNNKWNSGMGNYVTILHAANGVSTYYGHLMSVFVKPGDAVNIGDKIGFEGKTGKTTGCHVHFQVMGAKNPFAKYPVGHTQ